MEAIREFLRRIGYFFTRSRRSRELEAEMAFHREMAVRAGRSAGSFGNPAVLREQSREAWGWTWIDRLFQDLHYAVRMLIRSPGFTISAVFILAIGIGVNVAAFSMFNFTMLQPLPIRDPASLRSLERRSLDQIGGQLPYTTAIFYRDHAKTLSAMLLMTSAGLELNQEVEPVRANFVSANFFQDLGASAAYGRLLDRARDDAGNAPPVAVLGYEYWQDHFAADPSIVGKLIYLNRKPVTVVGVVPDEFPGLRNSVVDLWMPLSQQPYVVEGSTLLSEASPGAVSVWARLAPGVTPAMAEAELLNLTNERRKLDPKNIWKDEYIHTEPGSRMVRLNPRFIQVTVIFGSLTLLILFSACANLGGLLLARGIVREHELSIRLAIGASRQRIFRQLLTESVLLAVLGSAVGLVLACTALHIMNVLANGPKWWSVTPDWRVVLYTVALTFFASLLFGFTPAMQMARQKHKGTLIRQILAGAQVAVSCVLLIVASLMVHSAQHMIYSDPGFGYEQVISVAPQLNVHDYKPGQAQAYLDQLETRLRAIPSVASVALIKMPPLGRTVSRIDSKVDGRTLEIYPNWVSREFFPTMEIPILAGRNFLPGEKSAVIVSQSLARRQWPGENPLGKIYWDKDVVVGVAGNARMNALNDSDAVEIYSPVQPEDMPSMAIVLRTKGAPDGFTPVLKSMVQNLDPKLFPEITLIRSSFREATKSLVISVSILSGIGILAVVLAGLGILGLVAFTISQRNKEIAIRLALGSRGAQALAAILHQFLWPVLAGLIVGLGLTVAFSNVLRSVLFGVNNLDPISYAAAVAILLGILALAVFLPARRALQLDIARTLHEE